MRKYKVGDKVVIRKDLVVGEAYGDYSWGGTKDYLKNKDYVVIEEVYSGGDYLIEGWYINNDMIQGLYKEETKVSKYKVGDKVVIRKDLVVGEIYGGYYWKSRKEYLKEKGYVVIDEVDFEGDYEIEGYGSITDDMIQGLYQESDRGILVENVEGNVEVHLITGEVVPVMKGQSLVIIPDTVSFIEALAYANKVSGGNAVIIKDKDIRYIM